jgi:hypothetical protein
MATGNKTINAWDWDVRVRERNLRRGIFDAKDLDKHLSQLTDVSEQAEPLPFTQPATGGSGD